MSGRPETTSYHCVSIASYNTEEHVSFGVCLGPLAAWKNAWQVVRDRLVVHRQKEKASYSGLFDKGPMYNDKEVTFVH